jgi:hypothetical protein
MPQRILQSDADYPPPYKGEVVYIYGYDVAYDTIREPVTRILGQDVAQFSVDASKRTPRELFFYRPQMVSLPPMERAGPSGLVRVERTIKIFPVGAISVTVRVPFEVARLEDLVAFHDLQLGELSLHDEVRRLVEEARTELAGYFIRPVEQITEEEAYTVFCVEAPPPSVHFRTESWLKDNVRAVAALLTQEANPEDLSLQEAEESTSNSLSYYKRDLVVVDWDAALVIDQPQNFQEILHIMELANVQLAELTAYDRILDRTIESSYRDLKLSLKGRANVVRDLREIRIDLARLSDELSNITKFFGDWHLARVYQQLSARFHLGDWHRSIDEKLKTLDELYQILKQDQNNRLMVILEVTIVLLFIIDLVVLILPLIKR